MRVTGHPSPRQRLPARDPHRGPTIGNAAPFSLSSILNFASCTDHELARGHSPAYGDLGMLHSGVDAEPLAGLLSTSGLLRYARGRGLDLARIEHLGLQPPDQPPRPQVPEAFTTAPDLQAPTQELGLSTAQGAVYAGLRTARDRLRDTVLHTPRQAHHTQQSAPAY